MKVQEYMQACCTGNSVELPQQRTQQRTRLPQQRTHFVYIEPSLILPTSAAPAIIIRLYDTAVMISTSYNRGPS